MALRPAWLPGGQRGSPDHALTIHVPGGGRCPGRDVSGRRVSGHARYRPDPGAEYNLADGQLTIVAADTGTAAVLTATVTATGQKIGTLTDYYTAQDPTDVQAGVFTAGEPTEITVTSNLGGHASSTVSRYYKPPY